MKPRRKYLEIELRQVKDWKNDLDARLKAYEAMHRWMAVHAPATLRRYPGTTPVWRLSQMEQVERALIEDYAPALRAQLDREVVFLKDGVFTQEHRSNVEAHANLKQHPDGTPWEWDEGGNAIPWAGYDEWVEHGGEG